MILRDERIPLELPGRAIVGIAARAHRKGVAPEEDSLYSLLTAQDQRTAVVLSAILRAADGLDYLHSSAVTGITCTVSPEMITIVIQAGQDVSSERSRAQLKSDLLARVFLRTVVVR